MNANTQEVSLQKVNRIKFQMIYWFSGTFAVMIIALSSIIISFTNQILKNKVAQMENELNRHSVLNLDSYITQVESSAHYAIEICTPLLTPPEGQELTTKELSAKLERLSRFLKSFSVVRNHDDLALLFDEGYFAGVLKNDWADHPVRPSYLYDTVNEYLNSHNCESAWISGQANTFFKIYYVQRLDNKAIFVCSIDTRRIGEFILRPNNLNLRTEIINDINEIIYSSSKDRIGTFISAEAITAIGSPEPVHIYKNSLYSINSCSNGWSIITSTSMKNLMQDSKKLITYVIIITCLAVGITMIFCIIYSLKLTKPVENLLSALHTQATKDRVTKFYNEETFKELASETLKAGNCSQSALFYIDIDNFGSVIEHVGRSESDKIIYEISFCIREAFPKGALLGRVSTDRFLVFCPVDQRSEKTDAGFFCEELNQKLFARFQGDFDITASIGIALYPDNGKAFPMLFDMSERAMRSVKNGGRNDWHIFDPSKDFNSWQH